MNQIEMELLSIPNMDGNERIFLNNVLGQLEGDQRLMAIQLYKERRKDPQAVMALAILGLAGIAGMHRMYLGQTFYGLVYFFTGGWFLVGTIIDLFNINRLAREYNTLQASEAVVRVMTMAELAITDDYAN